MHRKLFWALKGLLDVPRFPKCRFRFKAAACIQRVAKRTLKSFYPSRCFNYMGVKMGVNLLPF